MNKKFEYMEIINVNIGWSDANYSCVAEDKALNGIVVVAADTLDGLKKEFVESLKFHIEGCIKDGDFLPEWLISGDYEIIYSLNTSALLHSLDGILTQSAIARVTGINQRQIGHYASGFRKPRKGQREKIINGIHAISRELASVV